VFGSSTTVFVHACGAVASSLTRGAVPGERVVDPNRSTLAANMPAAGLTEPAMHASDEDVDTDVASIWVSDHQSHPRVAILRVNDAHTDLWKAGVG
jgi:hypothetical protein